VAIGDSFGLRGIEAARADYCATKITGNEVSIVRESFRRLFSIRELITTLVCDINQQDAEVERFIDRDSLTRWAGDPDENKGFDMHSIFFDEDNKSAYQGEPKAENAYMPFVNHDVVLQLLLHLFTKS